MPHGLQKSADTPGAVRGAEEDGNAEIVAGLAGKVLEYFLASGNLIH